jgi:hypothetical protein
MAGLGRRGPCVDGQRVTADAEVRSMSGLSPFGCVHSPPITTPCGHRPLPALRCPRARLNAAGLEQNHSDKGAERGLEVHQEA